MYTLEEEIGFGSTMCSQTWSQYILVWSLLVAFAIVYAKLTACFLASILTWRLYTKLVFQFKEGS